MSSSPSATSASEDFGWTPVDRPTILTPVEQAGPRLYLRALFCFPSPAGCDQDEMTRILADSLECTKTTIPFLAAELVPEQHPTQDGRLKFQYGDHGNLTAKDLTDDGAFPLSYDELRQKKFPADAFDGDTLCPITQLVPPGTTTPALVVQANFISGGLILSMCIHHMVADAAGLFRILQVWAANCRRIQGLPSEVPDLAKLSPELLDRSVIKSCDRPTRRFEVYPEYRLFDEPLTSPPAGLLKTNHRTQVFHFSESALKRLKADAAADVAGELDHRLWISTNDALSALVWRASMAAAHDADSLKGNPKSSYMIAVNGRPRTSPPYAPDHLACHLFYANPVMDLRDVISTDTKLGSIALAIRRAVNRVDGDYIDSVVALLEKVPDFRRFLPSGLMELLNSSLIITSWAMFDMFSIDWGEKLGGFCDSIRAPHQGFFHGLHFVSPPLPERLGGGLEVTLGLEEQNFARLGADAMWAKYAVLRG